MEFNAHLVLTEQSNIDTIRGHVWKWLRTVPFPEQTPLQQDSLSLGIQTRALLVELWAEESASLDPEELALQGLELAGWAYGGDDPEFARGGWKEMTELVLHADFGTTR